MTTFAFALEKQGPKEIEVEWSGVSEVIVRMRGTELARFHAEHLKAGFDVKLPDGRELHIRRTLLPPALVVTRDGVPLAGSGTDPEVALAQAWKQTAAWAAGYGLWGGMTLARADAATIEPEGVMAFGVALGLAVLAYLTRRRWLPAVAITAAVGASYLAYWAIATASRGGSIVLGIPFLLIPFWYMRVYRALTRSAPHEAGPSAR